MPVLRRPRDPGLEERLTRWVDAGLISADQARAVTRFEDAQPGGGLPTAGKAEPSPGLPPLAEALAYLGIVLVAASGTLVVVRFWRDLHLGGQMGIAALVAVLGLGAGAVLTRTADAGARRLGSFLSLCGTAGVGLAAGVLAADLGGHDAGVTALVAGLAVLLVSVGLWRNRDRLLPFLSSLGGAVATLAGLRAVIDLHPTPAEVGWTVWGAGVVLAGLGWWHALRPPLASLLVGVVGALGGAMAVADRHDALGAALGLATAVVAVVGGVGGREPPLVAVGVAGFLVFLARILAIYVQGTVSALVVLFLGVVLVIYALERWRHHGGGHPKHPGAPAHR